MLNLEKRKDGCYGVVYDISLDGTFVNALGMNVLHNTDGFQLPNAFNIQIHRRKPLYW